MVQVTKNGIVLLIPRSAYEADYKNYGWKIKVGEKQETNVALSEVQDPKKAKVHNHVDSSALSENDVVMLPLASAEVSPVVKL